MTLEHATQNARHFSQDVTFTDANGDAVDLTNSTLYGKKRDNHTGTQTSITGTLVLLAATAGVFTWTYSIADLAEPGAYSVQFMAVFSDGLREKTPVWPWRVFESLEFASVSPSASTSASASSSLSQSRSGSPSASKSPSPSSSKSPSSSASP